MKLALYSLAGLGLTAIAAVLWCNELAEMIGNAIDGGFM